MESFLKHAKSLAPILAALLPQAKTDILNAMANAIKHHSKKILEANAKDMNYAKKIGLDEALLDRLALNKERIEDMANSIFTIAKQKEPLGRILDGWLTNEGLRIEKVSVPIGIIGIIYESRPNVTADTAALCFKSGNICILKGGKEASFSNQAIAGILQEVLKKEGLDPAIISLLPDESREGVANLIKQDKYVDLIIPRGGEGLIRFVSQNATVPVIKHDKGLCHIFVDLSADIKEAIKIVQNAKCQRSGVCNAVETLLVHEKIAKEFLPSLSTVLKEDSCVLFGCEKTQTIISTQKANNEAFATEYLSKKLNIKIVLDTKEAIEHIEKYSSGHSEAILTQNYTNAECFLNAVDSACVYVNASTRFTDGGAFGFGAEVGISTNKLHARGPMGINELCTYKFKIYGKGQVRG